MTVLAIVNCSCGESVCNDDGRCSGCGKQRMLPRKLADKANAVEKALDDFKDTIVEWMNKETK